MSRTQSLGLLVAITAIAACGAGVLFFALWRDYLLYALAASALLLSGGATVLPSKNAYLHGFSIGLCLGAFIGSALGAAKCLGPEDKQTFSLSLESTRTGKSPFTAQLQR